MILPSLETFFRWLALAAVFVILIPCQIFIQTHFYGTLTGNSPLFTDVLKALGVGACIIEAVSMTLGVAALRRGEFGKGISQCAYLWLIVLPCTFAIDVSSMSTVFSGDARTRAEAVAAYSTAGETAQRLDAEITRLTASMPEAYRDKPITALTIEREGIERRLNAYAVAPPRLVRTQIELDSAVATRTVIDERVGERERLTATLSQPQPEADHPQVVFFRELAGLVGLNPSAVTIQLIIIIGSVAMLKFGTLVTAWSAVPRTPNRPPSVGSSSGSSAPPTAASPATPSPPPPPQSTPNPVITPFPSPVTQGTAPTAPNPAPPPTAAPPKSKGSPGIAAAFLRLLNQAQPTKP